LTLSAWELAPNEPKTAFLCGKVASLETGHGIQPKGSLVSGAGRHCPCTEVRGSKEEYLGVDLWRSALQRCGRGLPARKIQQLSKLLEAYDCLGQEVSSRAGPLSDTSTVIQDRRGDDGFHVQVQTPENMTGMNAYLN
jgi:hypothetical protein